jgi:hypothetical protein
MPVHGSFATLRATQPWCCFPRNQFAQGGKVSFALVESPTDLRGSCAKRLGPTNYGRSSAKPIQARFLPRRHFPGLEWARLLGFVDCDGLEVRLLRFPRSFFGFGRWLVLLLRRGVACFELRRIEFAAGPLPMELIPTVRPPFFFPNMVRESSDLLVLVVAHDLLAAIRAACRREHSPIGLAARTGPVPCGV